MTTTPGRGRPATAGRAGETGMVTAETAVVLPSIALVLVAGLVAVDAVLAHLRCFDAAAVGARLAARGEPATVVRQAAATLAPRRATVQVRWAGGSAVRVEVSAPLPLPGPLRLPFGARVDAVFVAPVEPGVGPTATRP